MAANPPNAAVENPRPDVAGSQHRRPAFLHLRMVRLMGHAGSDYEPTYRRPDEIAAEFDWDPVLCTAQALIGAGVLTPAEALARYEAKRANVIELAGEVADLPQLDSAAAVMEPLQHGLEEAAAASPESVAAAVRSGESDAPLTLALAINRALAARNDRWAARDPTCRDRSAPSSSRCRPACRSRRAGAGPPA